jgi:16S rRNA (guanine966-N2)-methyltransferase
LRIVGGRFKGRALQGPSSRDIRPTSDRLRESLFNILTHWEGANVVSDARVIDLFAGTGALGLEALSRGARFTLFVEDGAEARALIRENLIALGLAGTTRIFRRDATKLGDIAVEPFTLAFLDPPYGKGLADAALRSLDDGGWLAPGAMVVVEEAAEAEITAPSRFDQVDARVTGDSKVVLYRVRLSDTLNGRSAAPRPA